MQRGAFTTRHEAQGIRVLSRVLTVVAFALLCEGLPVHAQEKAPKSFYKKDYASAPGAGGRAETEVPPERTHTHTTKDRTSATATKPPSKDKEPKTTKRRVVVSVYVNSQDPAHLQKVLAEVYQLHDEQRAFVASVEHIGNYASITPDIEENLSRRSIDLRAATLPSLDANLTTSPAWIIMTPHGVHIAEGIIEIHSLFNEYGEYDPKKDPNAESKLKVEGF